MQIGRSIPPIHHAHLKRQRIKCHATLGTLKHPGMTSNLCLGDLFQLLLEDMLELIVLRIGEFSDGFDGILLF